MAENKKPHYQIVFWLELILAAIIPIIICWRITPTKVLNSNLLFRLLESAGILGSILMFFVGIPVGIFGIIKAKKMKKLRIPTTILSVINIIAGLMEIIVLILIIYAVFFKGVSH